MKIFVTGPLGFIGSHICELFGYLGFGVNPIYHNIQWPEMFKEEGSDNIIIHCAKSNSFDAPSENRKMDDQLIEFCETNPGNKLIYLSTTNSHEDTQYVIEKRKSEDLIVSYLKNYVIFKITAPYGPGQKSYTFINTSIDRASSGLDIYYFGDGERQQDFIYIDDLTRLILNACQRNHIGLFNASYGMNYSTKEVLGFIAKFFGVKVFQGLKKDPDSGLNEAISNIDTRDTFMWHPGISLQEGIQRTATWRINSKRNKK